MQYALPVREQEALLLLCYVVIQETLRGLGGNILSVSKKMLRHSGDMTDSSGS